MTRPDDMSPAEFLWFGRAVVVVLCVLGALCALGVLWGGGS